MYFNGYTVHVTGGKEQPTGHVVMKHAQKYSIALHNSHTTKCDATITIDGKEVGTFRLNAYGSATIERPVNDDGHFTFYKKGTRDSAESKLSHISKKQLGLVSVTFKPEKEF